MSSVVASAGRVIAETTHLLGAIGLSAGLISEFEIVGRLRSLAASDVPDAFRCLLQLRWTVPSYVALAVSSCYLTLQQHRVDVAWLSASIAGFVILATADLMTARSFAALRKRSRRNGLVADAVLATVDSRPRHVSRWIRGLVMAGVILLTQAKPGAVGAFVIIASALLLGVVSGVASFGIITLQRRI